jgi:hypothetical protein
VRVARGTYANLSTTNALAALQEGEICFATDQDKLYVKEGAGLTSISASSTASPAPSNITASPAFASGTGTQADPFVVTSAAVPFSGGTAESAQEITLTGTAGDFVIFTDNSVSASGNRFSGQVVGNVDSGGTFKFKLKYEDTPGTTVNNTTYNGLVQIGTAHFSFTVVQSNLTALSQSSASSIAGTGGVGNVLTCTPGTATGGTGTITYATRWQRSFNGIDGFFDIGGATGNTYTQQNSDAGYYVRAVVTATDATPAGQGGPLTLELPSGVTAQIPTGAAPVINNLVLSEDDTTGARFTSKVFSADFTMGNDGTPTSQKSIKGTVTANFENFPSTDAVSSTTSSISYSLTQTNRVHSNNIASSSSSNFSPVGIFAQDLGNTIQIVFYHGSGVGSNSSSIQEKIFNVSTGSTTSGNYFSESYSSRINYTNAFQHGVDPDGRKYINWGFGSDNNGGTTYYYADPGTSPSTRRRGFEITMSDGTHFYVGVSSSADDIFRRRPGESSHSRMYMNSTTMYYYMRNNVGCEFNGKLFYMYERTDSTGGAVWFQIPTTAAGSSAPDWINDGTLYTGSYNGGITTQFSHPNHLFVHKNTLFLVADWKLWKYNTSGNSWTQIQGNLPSQYVFNTFQDDTYLYVQRNNGYSTYQWYRSNNLGVTWVADFSGSGAGESYYSSAGCAQGNGGARIRAFGWDLYAANYNNSWGYKFVGKQFNQATVTFASNSQLSNINPGDFMRVNGETDILEYAYVQAVNVSSNQLTLNMNTNPTAGQTMETLASTGSSSATKYLVISSQGNITGYQGSDPGFVEISPGTNIDLTFPATFPSGNAPDDEFAAGTVMQVTGKATNVSASDTFNSNQVTPT